MVKLTPILLDNFQWDLNSLKNQIPNYFKLFVIFFLPHFVLFWLTNIVGMQYDFVCHKATSSTEPWNTLFVFFISVDISQSLDVLCLSMCVCVSVCMSVCVCECVCLCVCVKGFFNFKKYYPIKVYFLCLSVDNYD